MNKHYDILIERENENGEEITYGVTADSHTYRKGWAGTREDPPEAPEIEINGYTVENEETGEEVDIDLTDSELTELEDYYAERAEEDAEGARVDAAYERYRDREF